MRHRVIRGSLEFVKMGAAHFRVALFKAALVEHSIALHHFDIEVAAAALSTLNAQNAKPPASTRLRW